MDLPEWLQKNSKELFNTTKNITKSNPLTDDLFQEVCLQLLTKPDKINELPDDHKFYYFIRVVKNNWHSNTSPFQYHRTNYNKRHIPYDDYMGENLLDSIYEETIPDMQWVKNELYKMDWYDRDLFLLWIELGTFTKVSQETTIPLNSVGKYIKKIQQKLNSKWEHQKKYI